MGEGIKSIDQKVTSFKRKYYLNLLVRGLLLTASLVLVYFLMAALLEYNLWLGKGLRLLIVMLFFVLVALCIFLFLREPLRWWIAKRGLGEEESARIIGDRFPFIKDRLLNLIQLASLSQKNALVQASIAQKSNTFEGVSFDAAIDLSENKRYLKLFLIPFFLIGILFFINKSIFTQSTTRIVKFNEEFSPQAPFLFALENQNLTAFLHEDFTLKLRITGSVIPDAAYLLNGKQRLKMVLLEPGLFEYTFEKIQDELNLQFEASGFYSKPYKISIISRPELIQMKVQLNYPGYLGKKREELSNVGNLDVPEGTKITWTIGTSNASNATILFSSQGRPESMQSVDNQSFNFSKDFRNPDQYSITLENPKSKNKDRISYSVNVTKDAFPQIVVNDLRDSILYKTIFLGGILSDDYGITKLKLNYQVISNSSSPSAIKEIVIPILDRRQQQNFFYQWSVDSLKLNPGDKINYHLQVWDNDGVNGHKSTRSANYIFALPTSEELKSNIAQSQESAESKIDQSIKKSKDLKESINEAQQKLKGKQSLEWQDKKMLEDLIQQKEKLDQAIKDLQKENSLLEQKKETFSEESERIKEKSEQIQKLMNELLDEETKKLFEQLEKLLKENSDLSQIQKMLEKMDRKEINLEKELERTLELFKQLQYDYKLEQSIEDITEQTKAQEELMKKTEELGKKSDKDEKGENQKDGSQESSNEKLAQEQEELEKKLDDFKEELKDLEKLGEELEKDDLPGEEQMEQIEKSQENSKESLKQGKPKKSAEHQKNTINQMKQVKDQLEGMQSSMEMEMDMENLEALRHVLHGLIKLSYDQEALMKDFNAIQQTDPKYVQLSQNQLKIKDDSKVLEDSLLSLAKRDAFMSSIVTKEVGELNDHIDKAVGHIKDRRKGNAGSEMQFSMTGMNNLALMLNEHYNQMMNMMANSMPQMGKGKGKKSKMPKSLSELQKQLNQQIQQLKNGNMPGRQLSEELAKTAAEQERIRRALQEMQQQLKNEGGKGIGDDIPGKMEQTEMDLVNKNITEQTIRRQQEILTRLLETEKSMREQDMDEERKGETAKDYTKEIPKAFEEYLRLKEKEVELLKTVPPKLFPYYKKEVNDYFKRIENQN